ncbi:hypothetical protein FBUS_11228 [Fasciolopsis buskii]|uniref:Uncharacterized protein n=1 Tax=Fasciolopsis buskii TaxID=27845 RepID=A0A8E0RKL8_9TREM|nr:hypothetical protein FBUS_11228 [Fasciolopsis buski]
MSTLPVLQQQQQQNGHPLNDNSVPNDVTVSANDNKTVVVYSPPVHSPVTSVNEADSGEDLTEASHVRNRLDPMRIDLNCSEFRRIEAMILSDPRITQSRDWTAYTQANEWTRATCSLMSALFTSGEMAQCTVLGRGIKEPRQRLPVDKALYIVGNAFENIFLSPKDFLFEAS